MSRFYLIIVLVVLGIFAIHPTYAQRKKETPTAAPTYEEKLFNSLQWRNVGPFRGGRSAAVTGVPGQPNLYYFGATGGGVWRTTDAGASWENISDGFFGGSIGAVAVSESDNNVMYVGGGEKTVRGNVSHGNGMWKSLDAGKTWEHVGLKDSRHITRIRIHPNNPNLVYAAVLGHLFGPNQERGVYRSQDGGKTWEQKLFVNEQAGAVDLILDPVNPRILYASTWRIIRTPHSLESGGEGSALWKSTDGGDTWTELTKTAEGLPKGTLGIIGVTVSPVNHERVWAILEANEGGVYRSDDGGKTWSKVNTERKLRQRAWYYTRIYADTKNADQVYVLNVEFHISKDGGKTYESIDTPHGDHHDLWISPDNPNHMIIGDDGGAQVSLNGGQSWSTYHNQPTAQFYRVVTDNNFPYRMYGGQQDNSTVRILSQGNEGGITERDWEETAGGESAHIAPNPDNPDIVYGGSYGGYLTRENHRTGERCAVDVYPNNPMGWAAKDLKYRFQWNFPIFFSPHTSSVLYTAANVLFKTTNEGQSWEAISPDLTRNDTTKMYASGGPITKDNTSVEYYGTIFAAAESPYEKDLIWTGSDDGMVYITRDGGKNWNNVTPKGMPEWMMINSVEPHPFIKGGCYIAGTRYKSDDFRPYLYKTTDYGATWTKITQGIPEDHFTRVVRADPKKAGVLYAGTESGMYVSFDDGTHWQPFQLNLPIVPITDLTIKENDLIAATQGRGFWILDDLSILHQVNHNVANNAMHLYKPSDTYNWVSGDRSNPKFEGKNPPSGVAVHFYLKNKPDSTQVFTLEFMDSQGKLIRKFSSAKAPEKRDPKNKTGALKVKEGANLFVWDMRHEEATRFDRLILWAGGTQGPRVTPGKYQVRLSLGDQSQTHEFEIKKDPRIQASQADLEAQMSFLLEIRDKLSETNEAIIQIREVNQQINSFTERIKDQENYKDILENAKSIKKQLGVIENNLYQTKNQSSQDPLNYPIRLNNKLSAVASLASIGYNRPTTQMIAVKEEMTGLINEELQKLNTLMQNEIPAFNKMVTQQNIPVIFTEKGAQ
ncbi:MAG: glycosyl hydrolase [Microscillaceae bacterium]|nr:glycosyl hydrolase [Microscillaceae bacterium]